MRLNYICLVLILFIIPIAYAPGEDPDKLVSTPQIIQYGTIYVTVYNANDMDSDLFVRYPDGTISVFYLENDVDSGEELVFTNTSAVGSYKFYYFDNQDENHSSYSYVAEITNQVLAKSIQIIPMGVSTVQKGNIAVHEWQIAYPYGFVNIDDFECVTHDQYEQSIPGIDIDIVAHGKILTHSFNTSTLNATEPYHSFCSFTFTINNITGSIINITQYVYVTDETWMRNILRDIINTLESLLNYTMDMLGLINQTTQITLNITNATYNYVIIFHNETMTKFELLEEYHINTTELLKEPVMLVY